MLLALFIACADKSVNISIEDRKYEIEHLSPLIVDADLAPTHTFDSVEVSVPALSTLPIDFQIHPGTNYFAIVIEDGSGVRVESTYGFGPVKNLILNFRSIRYAVFNDPFVAGYNLTIKATNETIIDGVKMYIGFSDSPEYLTSYMRESRGSYILDDHVTSTIGYSCTDRVVNGVKQPRSCTSYSK
ncbi:MAG: hypothetical protein NUV56_01075 [Candidatus Uhrbacteria bacterium]|nr:hypothetical protein [Candidatus Uhrbacteria bacterium]